MTQQERQRRLELERNFRAKRPNMPTGKNAAINTNKHFGAVYGKSTTPINHPRPKGQANKIAIKAEGAGSFGYSPRNEDQGYKNGEKGVPCAINRQSLAMEAKIDRWLAQARKERNNRAKPMCVVVGPGYTQPSVKKASAPSRYSPVKSAEEQAKEAKVMPTWGTFGERTLAVFRSKWR